MRYLPHFRGVIAYGLGPALGLISGPILARALGPVGRGQFASVMEPLTLGGAVASIGLPAAATYFVASGMNQRQILWKTLSLGFIISLITYGTMVWYSEQVSETQGLSRWVYVAAWSTVIASALVQILRGYWQGRSAWRRLDAERFSFAILRFTAVVVIGVLGFQDAEYFVGGALLAFITAGAILVSPSLVRRDSRPLVPSRRLYTYSFSAALGTIAVVASNRLDQVILPIVASSAELGFYAVAVTVAEVPIIFAALAGRNALTLASKGATFREIMVEIGPFILAGWTLALALMAGAPIYTPLLFGSDFAQSISSVQILSAGTFVSIIAFAAIAIVAGWHNPLLSSAIPASGLITTCIAYAILGAGVTSELASWISLASQAVAAVVGALVVLMVWRRRVATMIPVTTR